MDPTKQIRKVIFPVEGRDYDSIGLSLLMPIDMSEKEYQARMQIFISSSHHQLMMRNLEAFHAVIQYPLEKGACPGLSPEIVIDQITKVKGTPENTPVNKMGAKYVVHTIKAKDPCL